MRLTRYLRSLAQPDHVEIMRVLQSCRAARLVEPVGAAIESRTCRLTALGRHYWAMAQQRWLSGRRILVDADAEAPYYTATKFCDERPGHARATAHRHRE